jgi:hypothetical protein
MLPADMVGSIKEHLLRHPPSAILYEGNKIVRARLEVTCCASSRPTCYGVIIWEIEGNIEQIIRVAECKKCGIETDKFLPLIDTFLQRHVIISGSSLQYPASYTNCMLERSHGSMIRMTNTRGCYVCACCRAAHVAEKEVLVNKWLLARALFGRDLGGCIGRIMIWL